MEANKKHQKCGIYCIRNIINNKVYIGKSKNIYKRIHQHIYDMKNKRKTENPYLLQSWIKYGNENFEYFVLEYLEENEELVSEKELYWMNKFNSLDRKNGYNLRQDSSSKMIVHEETSKKISERLKKEWSSGIRNLHSEKLKQNWKNNPDRVLNQSKLFSKIKTKYNYIIYDLDNTFIENCDYKRLKELKLQNVTSQFFRKKNNNVKWKEFLIKRVKIEDIVQSS